MPTHVAARHSNTLSPRNRSFRLPEFPPRALLLTRTRGSTGILPRCRQAEQTPPSLHFIRREFARHLHRRRRGMNLRAEKTAVPPALHDRRPEQKHLLSIDTRDGLGTRFTK